ncbi:MAG: hypothetical protein HY961_04900 [Ignavibacteriae bacterium]|nr:hypothetical protein [Ignavibacteriota bacterium]
MPIERTLLLDILNRLLSVAEERGDASSAELIEKLKRRCARSNDLQSSLHELHNVAGFGEFAIRLLWLMRHVAVEGRLLSEFVLKSEAERLYAMMANSTLTHGCANTLSDRSSKVSAESGIISN